ncbi:MAG TPA: hypothetical protein DCF45_12865 [Gammaproteobacteria bacterium]|nr:hypothetical protein [Gammaproteobacteria bacterium]
MQIFLDFLPVIAFFVVYQLDDIYSAVVATALAAASVFAFTWYRKKRIEPLQLSSLLIICAAAALTVLFHDDAFIKWKPTIVNGLFAAVFSFSLISKKTLAERLLGSQLALPAKIWRTVTISWILFFIFCALANYVVAFIYSVDFEDLSEGQKAEYQLIRTDDTAYAALVLNRTYETLTPEARQKIAERSANDRAGAYLQFVHQEQWVNFKLFGMLALTIVFILSQGLYLSRYLTEPDQTPAPKLRNT